MGRVGIVAAVAAGVLLVLASCVGDEPALELGADAMAPDGPSTDGVSSSDAPAQPDRDGPSEAPPDAGPCADPNALLCDDFDSYDASLDALAAVWTFSPGGGTYSFEVTNGTSPPESLRLQLPALDGGTKRRNQAIRSLTQSAPTSLRLALRAFIAQLDPPYDSNAIVTFDFGGQEVFVTVNPSTTAPPYLALILQPAAGAATTASSFDPVPLNTWFSLRIDITRGDAGALSAAAFVNDVPMKAVAGVSSTLPAMTTPSRDVRLEITSGFGPNGAGPLDVRYDDVLLTTF